MNRQSLVSLACLLGLLIGLAGCASPDRRTFERTGEGAAVGAVYGATYGLLHGRDVLDHAAKGAAVGAAGGFVLDRIEYSRKD